MDFLSEINVDDDDDKVRIVDMCKHGYRTGAEILQLSCKHMPSRKFHSRIFHFPAPQFWLCRIFHSRIFSACSPITI